MDKNLVPDMHVRRLVEKHHGVVVPQSFMAGHELPVVLVH